MPRAAHLKLFFGGVATWAAFWVLGLPSYYQQYSFLFLAVGTAALVPPTAWLGWRIIARTRPEHRAARGFWLSVYFTAPFVTLDALYCGVYLGNGVGFFEKYWYLTVFYVLPWVLFLPTGLFMGRPARAG
jgi:hypothetical protein